MDTKTLFDAAKAAGVECIVHVSITNPSVESPFESFQGKAGLEQYLKKLGVSYAILRPAVFFRGLMAGLLAVDSGLQGTKKLTGWEEQNKMSLGRRYASELARRYSQ